MRGEVHHDRRLHQLMLAEASSHFDVSAGKSVTGDAPALSNATSNTTSLSDSAGSVRPTFMRTGSTFSASDLSKFWND